MYGILRLYFVNMRYARIAGKKLVFLVCVSTRPRLWITFDVGLHISCNCNRSVKQINLGLRVQAQRCTVHILIP